MPQQKGQVDEAQAKRLIAAMVGMEAARLERDAAITAALKAGGSTREVAAVVSMSPAQVAVIGRKGGWPTKDQREARDKHKAEIAEWNVWLDRGLEALRAEGKLPDQ